MHEGDVVQNRYADLAQESCCHRIEEILVSRAEDIRFADNRRLQNYDIVYVPDWHGEDGTQGHDFCYLSQIADEVVNALLR